MKRVSNLIAVELALVGLLSAGWAHAHGGGLNAEGCHTNRKTGDYHCHRAPATSPAAPQGVAAAQQPGAASKDGATTPQSARQRPGAPTCYTGPRGGTYTITASGKKNYGGC